MNIIWKILKFTTAISFIPLILVTIWFRSGNILGSAESGLPFYDFNIHYEMGKYAWSTFGLGHAGNILVTSNPSYWLLSLLQNIGIPGFMLQAAFFFIIFLISGSAVYFTAKELFPKLEQKFLFMAVFYYWFNPFSLVNVWNRFLNNYFIFYVLLPVGMLFFLRGIKRQNYIYSFLIGLSSGILSYASTSNAFNALFWAILFLTGTFYFIYGKAQNNKGFILKFFVLTTFYWFLINFWWIGQVLSYIGSGSFTPVTTNFFTTSGNYSAFTNLSESLGKLSYLFRLEHASFFNDKEVLWSKLYRFPLFVMLEFLAPIVVLVGIIFGRKLQSVLFLSIIFCLGIFLTKGNNIPFGEILDRLFLNFSFVQLFRNPFEKFGFMLPIAGSILFAFGVNILVGKLGRWRDAGLAVVFIYLILFLGFPFWTGLVFTSKDPPSNDPKIGYQVKIPDYYRQAAEWLKSQPDNFRILTLPLGGEGITYTWEKGYSGVELTNQLLPKPAISLNTTIPYYVNVVKDLEQKFLFGDNFEKILEALDVKYILLRPDIDWKQRQMRDPSSIKKILEGKVQVNQLKQKMEFGELSFWQNPNWKPRRIFAANSFIDSPLGGRISDIDLFGLPIVPLENSQKLVSENMISSTVLHSDTQFSIPFKPDGSFDYDQIVFPVVKSLPSSKIYPLTLLKENIDLKLTRDNKEKLRKKILFLGKRLVEVKLSLEKKDIAGAVKALDIYQDMVSNFKIDNFSGKEVDKVKIYQIFSKHFSLIEQLKSQNMENGSILQKLNNSENILNAKLIKLQLFPEFQAIEKDNFQINNRLIYQFEVKTPGDYQLYWGDKRVNDFFNNYETNLIGIQIDNKMLYGKPTLKGSALYLTDMNLPVGIHEIGINSPEATNLVDAPAEIKLKAGKDLETASFRFKRLDSYSSYKLSFGYLLEKGAGFEVLIETNSDSTKKGNLVPAFREFIGANFYDFGEQKYSAFFAMPNAADNATLVIRPVYWNDCETIFFTRNKERCKDKNFRKPYNKETSVVIKNITLTRQMTDQPYLVKAGSVNEGAPPKINFTKISPAEYAVDIDKAEKPFVLVLSELFDPEWQLLDESGQVSRNHFLVNLYANGWYLDKLGSYHLKVKFMPQDLLDLGGKVSLASGLVGVIIVGCAWFLTRKNEKHS